MADWKIGDVVKIATNTGPLMVITSTERDLFCQYWSPKDEMFKQLILPPDAVIAAKAVPDEG